MHRLIGTGLAILALAACQRGGEDGAVAPRGESTPGTPLAEGARAGYAGEAMPGPETSVGRGLGRPAGQPARSTEGFEARLDQAEADARTPVTEPVAVTGRVTGADEDSVRLETASGESLELLLPPPQQEYRGGLAVGSTGELNEGDEIRATYRMSEGEAVAVTIEVTRAVGEGQGSRTGPGTTEPEGRGSGEKRPGTLGSGVDD